jgi:AGCS family alanine or glycine:cation symporter
MTSFQALATAIAAQVGTGNIVGASTAIAAGGPGAIFWMWLAAFFGMATIYAEAVLAQKYKKVGDDGQVTGGPVYYIHAAFKGGFGKFMAVLFAILIILSLGFLGCAVQSNGIATAWNTVVNPNGAMQTVNILGANVPIIQPIVGAILAIVAFLIFAGGISSIASFTEKVVPAMACIFIVGSLFVIVTHITWIPEIFRKIFVGAFTPQAVFGGAVGVMIKDAVSKGIARGLFSNEAGMGSTPHAHAVAKVDHPSHQGYVAMIGVFIDTFIILDLTAFIVIGSGMFDPSISGANLTGAALAQAGFRTGFGAFGNIFIAFCLTFFAFSTVIGWYFFGEANFKYLFGTKAIKVYALIVCACVFLGSLAEVDWIWNLQDNLNGLMVIPNLIAILSLTKVVKTIMKEDNLHEMLHK